MLSVEQQGSGAWFVTAMKATATGTVRPPSLDVRSGAATLNLEVRDGDHAWQITVAPGEPAVVRSSP